MWLGKKAVSISDLRVIDMYEEAILDNVKLAERQGNWVQKYQSDEDAQLFAVAQFSRYTEVEIFLDENLKDMTQITHITRKRGESS